MTSAKEALAKTAENVHPMAKEIAVNAIAAEIRNLGRDALAETDKAEEAQLRRIIVSLAAIVNAIDPPEKPCNSFTVEASDGSGFATNGLRFPCRASARVWGSGLYLRWTACQRWRVVPSKDAPTTDTHLAVKQAVEDAARFKTLAAMLPGEEATE